MEMQQIQGCIKTEVNNIYNTNKRLLKLWQLQGIKKRLKYLQQKFKSFFIVKSIGNNIKLIIDFLLNTKKSIGIKSVFKNGFGKLNTQVLYT